MERKTQVARGVTLLFDATFLYSATTRDHIMADRGGGLKTSSSAKNNKDNNTNKKKYYAVASGRKPGVYETWDECKKQVFSFPNAQHKVKNNTFPPSFPPFARANAPLFDKRISRI